MSAAGGRPRADLEDAIAEATVRLLSQRGYQGLTMGDVATEAGIGKPTLYRRFASKADLVAGVLMRLGGGHGAPGARTTGDTRAALAGRLGAAARAIASPGGLAILGSLLAEAQSDPSLLTAFREGVFRPQQAEVRSTIAEGIERGELRGDVDVEALDAMLFGALLSRAVLGEPVDEDWAARVVAAAWPALATRPEGPA